MNAVNAAHPRILAQYGTGTTEGTPLLVAPPNPTLRKQPSCDADPKSVTRTVTQVTPAAPFEALWDLAAHSNSCRCPGTPLHTETRTAVCGLIRIARQVFSGAGTHFSQGFYWAHLASLGTAKKTTLHSPFRPVHLRISPPPSRHRRPRRRTVAPHTHADTSTALPTQTPTPTPYPLRDNLCPLDRSRERRPIPSLI